MTSDIRRQTRTVAPSLARIDIRAVDGARAAAYPLTGGRADRPSQIDRHPFDGTLDW